MPTTLETVFVANSNLQKPFMAGLQQFGKTCPTAHGSSKAHLTHAKNELAAANTKLSPAPRGDAGPEGGRHPGHGSR